MERNRYRREVERLLELIRDRVEELQLMKVRGVRGPALSEQKRALKRARKELAVLVTASSH
jgi:hypothetical protein